MTYTTVWKERNSLTESMGFGLEVVHLEQLKNDCLSDFLPQRSLPEESGEKTVSWLPLCHWCVSDFSVSYYLEINLGVSFVSVPGSIDLTFEPLPCLTLFGSTSEAQL